MSKRVAVGIMVCMIAVIAVALGVMLMQLMPPVGEAPVKANESSPSQAGIVNESQVAEIVEEHYPGLDFELEYNESCEETGESCWMADITEVGRMVISRTGEVVENIVWSSISCNYSYTEHTLDGDVYYQNMGCDNPLPACDMETEVCRSCVSEYDCLRKRTARFITGTPEQVLDWHGYDVVGTLIEGSFDNMSQKCTVTFNNSELFVDLIGLSECEEKILSYIGCTGGECIKLD